MPTSKQLSLIYHRRLVLMSLLVMLVLCGCDHETKSGEPFVEMAELSGVIFTHANELSGELTVTEVYGSGVGLFDYDLDGDLDIYLVRGTPALGSTKLSQGSQPNSNETVTLDEITAPIDRLFRNDSEGTNLRFSDVSSEAGVTVGDIGYGVAIGDLNADGYPDVYVSSLGQNRLLINNRQGGFFPLVTNVGGVAKETGAQLWSSSAVILDVNNDGRRDLYIANFIDPASAPEDGCRSVTTAADYCPSSRYQALSDQLLINIGNDQMGHPRFEDQSTRYGIDLFNTASIATISADFNDDGWPDIFVSNNAGDNILWINHKGRKFINEAAIGSVATGIHRPTFKSMGVDVADFDHDDDVDLVVAHGDGQAIALLTNTGDARFIDALRAHAITASADGGHAASVLFVDHDGDGDQDLFSANGAITSRQDQVDAGEVFPLRMANQLFENRREHLNSDAHDASVWAHKSQQSTLLMGQVAVSRGVAVGDIDNDGDADLLINNIAAPAELLINTRDDRTWLGVLPMLAGDRQSNIASVAVGATVRLLNAGEPQRKDVLRSRGYGSSSDPRIVFEVQNGAKRLDVLITWPGGEQEMFANLLVGRYHTLVQGTWQR